jgi:hypothetical protein
MWMSAFLCERARARVCVVSFLCISLKEESRKKKEEKEVPISLLPRVSLCQYRP